MSVCVGCSRQNQNKLEMISTPLQGVVRICENCKDNYLNEDMCNVVGCLEYKDCQKDLCEKHSCTRCTHKYRKYLPVRSIIKKKEHEPQRLHTLSTWVKQSTTSIKPVIDLEKCSPPSYIFADQHEE